MLTTEISNYVAWCRRPASAVEAALKFTVRAGWSLFARSLPEGRRLFQPREVRRARRALLRVKAPGPTARTPWQALPSCELTLTVGTLRAQDEPAWRTPFADEEVQLSLHRWNWLLRGLTDDASRMSREQGLNLMRSWIRDGLADPVYARDAYSTGERIVNACLFLRAEGGDVPADIQEALACMAGQISRHLEYYPDGQTGNHAFNHARALWFAGVEAGRREAIDLAYAIAAERLPTLVTSDGFLREGSSHYHFLFTRWVLEMLWLAERIRHEAFQRLLRPYAAQLVERCWFFLVSSPSGENWQMPLVGDVSPDFPPAWLVSLPWSSLALRVHCPTRVPAKPPQRGWADLFGSVESGDGGIERSASRSCPASGWYRIEHQPWTLFLRAMHSDGRLQAGHQHHDLAGYALFHCGAPVMVDCGRLDYTAGPLGQYGRTAASHNTLIVDGLGPSADGPAWLASSYAAVRPAVTVAGDAHETLVTLEHDGFSRRARGPIAHRRRWQLSATRVRIDDALTGTGACDVRLRCHLAPQMEPRALSEGRWQLPNASLRLDVNGLPATVLLHDERGSNPGGLFFPEYGRLTVCSTVEAAGACGLPATFSHTITDERVPS